MNKQELIKHFEEMEYVSITQMGKKSFIDLIEQLDEPQKPVVPQFVEDWIEQCKKLTLSLLGAILYAKNNDVEKWFLSSDNQELFARAWLDGYDVEKEKRYRVSVKNVQTRQGTLNRSKESGVFIFSNPEENNLYGTKFTRKELEDVGFGWVFDCEGIEVKEVE